MRGRRPAAGLVLGSLFFAIFAADLVFRGPITAADPAISAWLHDRMQPTVTQLLLLVTHVHSTLGLGVMSALVALVLLVRRRPREIGWMLLVVQGGQVLNWAVKLAFGRARPHWEDPILTLSSSSFPSGHAAGSTVFWGFVCMAVWTSHAASPARRAVLAVAVAMVALTSLSRVYLGAHYFSDVLAGVAEGIAWVSLCALLRSRVSG